TVTSPDGAVRFHLLARDPERLAYRVTFRDRAVIDTSALGVTVDGVDLGKGVAVGKAETYRLNEKYPWHGARAEITNHGNGARFPGRHTPTKAGYTLEVRAFDDGIAFRHVVPGADGPRVPDEATAFVLPAGSVVWYHDFEGHYEGVHQRKDV